ncbi:MAG: LPS export ABC transporter permease LptG [Pseudomonadota bacterium]
MTATLSIYVARRFFFIAATTFLGVLGLVLVVDMVELISSNTAGRASFIDLLWMAFLRAPSITIAAAPFTVLLAAMVCFAWFARSSELVVTRAAGISVWSLLAPALVMALFMGVVSFAVYNPVAAAFAQRFDSLEDTMFGRSSSRLSVAGGGVWLRQGDETGQTVIRAKRANETAQQLWRVSVFRFGPDNRFETRIDARRAVLYPGRWELNGASVWGIAAAAPEDSEAAARETEPELYERLDLPTNLTPEQIIESFAPPQTISFWDLPGFIRTLEESGFSSSRHRLHWHSLLAAPAVYFAMVLIGAAFSMRHVRFGGLGGMALGCVLTGFAYFFLSDVTGALGASGAVPVLLAAWGPPVAAVLFALGLLLHLEDG